MTENTQTGLDVVKSGYKCASTTLYTGLTSYDLSEGPEGPALVVKGGTGSCRSG